MDAPPVVGVLEALEALPLDELVAGELGAVLRSAALMRGRLDAVEARALAPFVRVGGHRVDGATDASSWLAAVAKLSGRDAHRVVKRAALVEVLPVLGDALVVGALSVSQVDVIAAIVPAALWPKAGELATAALVSTPEVLRL